MTNAIKRSDLKYPELQGGGRPSESSGWRARSCAAQGSCTGGAGFHMTVFELSYQGRDGCSGSERGWLWANGESAQQVEQDSHHDCLD
jgi:hypothetical protein